MLWAYLQLPIHKVILILLLCLAIGITSAMHLDTKLIL